MFVDTGACRMVRNTDELAAAVAELLEDPVAARALGRKGMEIVAQNRGSLNRLLALLDPLIDNDDRL